MNAEQVFDDAFEAGIRFLPDGDGFMLSGPRKAIERLRPEIENHAAALLEIAEAEREAFTVCWRASVGEKRAKPEKAFEGWSGAAWTGWAAVMLRLWRSELIADELVADELAWLRETAAAHTDDERGAQADCDARRSLNAEVNTAMPLSRRGWTEREYRLIKWYLAAEERAKPFHLSPGIKVRNPRVFYRSIRADIAAGPDAARSRTGALVATSSTFEGLKRAMRRRTPVPQPKD